MEVEKRGEMRGSGSNGVEYGGMGSINGQTFKRGPAGRVGLISLIARRYPDDGPSHMRRPVMGFIVCALISKMTEIRTWCDGCIRQSVSVATVRRCILQWLLRSSFLQNFLVMCLQI